jgi:hypothetical protein
VVFVAQIGRADADRQWQELKAIAALVLSNEPVRWRRNGALAVVGALFLTAVDNDDLPQGAGLLEQRRCQRDPAHRRLIDYHIRRAIEEQRRRARASEMKGAGNLATNPTSTRSMTSMEKAG